jgi:hypothetical protein
MMENSKLARDRRLNEPLPVLTEMDQLIATTEARIADQREYIRSVASDFGCSMQAIADLDIMTSALERLKRQRAQVVRWEMASH